ncbi:lamin tail-like protein [Nonlabens dokdonensis]|uniref:VCBS n=2 Tax=Nonlabens dokdonensis TaxID=328515 RepID=L7WD58_NONDD|nr:lamin tail domain-containing protein [Nonlabens dokdonensis]AGC78192.1 VCBS [Nonlabens dokdonensis DSW-6]PZX37915.1 lamin tail-like protein [Nonlabens dokdonensis]
MNKFFTLIILLSGFLMTAQVGIGTATPDPAAALDIDSQLPDGSYGGLKLPTMTLADRATIATPIPDGLMIYIQDGATRCVQIWDATQSSWMNWYCMNQLPVASAVNYTGTREVGETLTGSYTYTDFENDTESGTSFQWYRATDVSGTGSAPISGATSIAYTTINADGNQFLALGVTPQASSGASPGVEVLSTFQQISFVPTLLEFDRNATTIPEGDFRTIPITISNPNPTTATTVEIALDSGNTSTFGVLGTDYTIDNDGTNVTGYPFTVTIPAGATTFNNVTISILQDNDNAINEELYLILQNPSGGTTAALSGNQNDHVVYSDDDEFPTEVEFVSTSSSVEEPVTPDNTRTINIAITNPSSTASTTVLVTLNASSTVESGDYSIDYDGSPVTFPFTVTFLAGQAANESFTITSLNDIDTDDEILNIDLISPAGGIPAAAIGTNDAHELTINDDETPAGASDLFISEYIEDGGEKGLEIANFTGAPVNLNDYTIRGYQNSNTAVGWSVALSGTLANGDVYVVASSSVSVTRDQTTSSFQFNGNDAVALETDGGTLIDLLGTIGTATNYGESTVLRRRPGFGPSTTYDVNEFDTYSSSILTGFGSHTF